MILSLLLSTLVHAAEPCTRDARGATCTVGESAVAVAVTAGEREALEAVSVTEAGALRLTLRLGALQGEVAIGITNDHHGTSEVAIGITNDHRGTRKVAIGITHDHRVVEKRAIGITHDHLILELTPAGGLVAAYGGD